MALAAARAGRLDGVGIRIRMEVRQMKRVLFILFGVGVAVTVVGLMVALSRPIKWPANIAAPEWRRAVGENVEPELEAEEAGA
jgi:hypothetical protein